MATYAIISNGVVVNIAESEQSFAESQGWISLPEGFVIGDLYDGSSFSKYNPPSDGTQQEQ